MNIIDLPEVRFSQMLNEVGAFDSDLNGDSYTEQLTYFDEKRLAVGERGLIVIKEGDVSSYGDLFESFIALTVFVGKTKKGDGHNVNMFCKKIQAKLIELNSFNDIFGIKNIGINGPFILESGRHAYELRVQVYSNYCVNTL